MEQNMTALKSLMIFIFLLSACRRSDIWDRLRAGDFEIVMRGTYHGKTKYLPQPGIYKDKVKKYCSSIEKNPDVLPNITRKFFLVPDDLAYQYKFASVDEEKNLLILRYFARVGSHNLYAGYQIQFVFEISSDKVRQIFTAEVPLE